MVGDSCYCVRCLSSVWRWRSARCERYLAACVRGDCQILVLMMFPPSCRSSPTCEISTALPIGAIIRIPNRSRPCLCSGCRRHGQTMTSASFIPRGAGYAFLKRVDDTLAAEQVFTSLLTNSRRRGRIDVTSQARAFGSRSTMDLGGGQCELRVKCSRSCMSDFAPGLQHGIRLIARCMESGANDWM
jgi:hypothetical protein